MEEEQGRYRLPTRRARRGVADEIARFALCFALSEHERAEEGRGRQGSHRHMDIDAIKAGILGERIKPGDTVEGEAVASPFAAVYQPRAYYPAYVLGEMRAALRRGEEPPSASPHYLPVSLPPPLPDGWRAVFLYPADKEAFDRPDFPAGARDVLTRAYRRLPLLLPPHVGEVRGKVRFRATLRRLRRESMARLAGVGEDSFEIYAVRGLADFLQPEEIEAGQPAAVRGSLFTEIDLGEGFGRDGVAELLEDVVCRLAREVFPACERGERQDEGCRLPGSGHQVIRFRSRLFALVFDPVIAVFRAPSLVGLYLPCDVEGGTAESASRFEDFVRRFTRTMRDELGLAIPPQVEVAYDNLLPWAREGGALRGPAFQAVEEDFPLLRPTLRWLRGDQPAAP